MLFKFKIIIIIKKELYTLIKWDLLQVSANQSMWYIYHSNKLKNENHTVISTDTKNSTSIFDKDSSRMGLEGTYLNIIKPIYGKPTANILKDKKLKAFPLISRTRQGTRQQKLPILATFIQHWICNPSYSNQKWKRNKKNPIGKEEGKLPLFPDDMILYIENPRNSMKTIKTNKWNQ